MMTALAMIIGMLPMSLGLGEGGEQNAPLGRAVIGGLVLATLATLFFVPVVFSFLHRHTPKPAGKPSANSVPIKPQFPPHSHERHGIEQPCKHWNPGPRGAGCGETFSPAKTRPLAGGHHHFIGAGSHRRAGAPVVPPPGA